MSLYVCVWQVVVSVFLHKLYMKQATVRKARSCDEKEEEEAASEAVGPQ